MGLFDSRRLKLASVSSLALVAIGTLTAPTSGRTQAASPSNPVENAGAASTEVQAVIIRAAKTKAASVAPVASSLSADEPESVITRRFIEESAPRIGDYTTDAVLAPSLSTASNPNGPGSTDGAKLTLRGFTDGNYNTTYDGVAWGDTNGPSHHANSFFPSSTIGGIVVDRGPGDATALGQANFGGSVNLFSLPFEDHARVIQTITGASFGTWQAVTTLASGPTAKAHDANVVLNFMEYGTDGYLTNSGSRGQNQFVKFTVPVSSRLRLTALYTHNWDQYYQSDSNSTADVAQTTAYGKRFALSNDPTQSTYYKYNKTTKVSDFEYLRGDLDLDHGLALQDIAYSYAYYNRTFAANNTLNDQTIGATALAAANVVTLDPPAAYPAPGKGYSATAHTYGIPGYDKLNAYRVTGNIFQATQQTGMGLFTAGILYEAANTQRHRLDYDLLNGESDYREKAAVYAGPSGCGASPTQAANGACEVPLDVAYVEYSGWRQYQAFTQFEWKPISQLTITPGFKYVNFDLFVHAPELAISGSIQPSFVDHTYTKPLGFLTANYRVQPNLSVYGQVAQGFLVPNISAFYVVQPNKGALTPQLSTNYQLGTVFAGRGVTFDADIYYINFTNRIQTITDLATNETYETNSGNAIYKGVEAEATYLLPRGISVYGNGSLNDAQGYGDKVNPGNNGRQLALAPFWTAALGARFAHSGIFSGDDAVIATINTKWIGQQYANAASGSAAPTALIRSWAETSFTTTYRNGRYAVEGQVLNLFDSSDVTAFKGKALIAGTNLPATTIAQGGALNVFTYQAGRSVQITLKADF